MASAIPYDPDDFENNNPFAEPHESSILAHPVNEPEVQHDNEQVNNEDEHETSQPPESPPHENLVEQELIRLLPERFTSTYLIKIVLKGIESNKPANPILRFDVEVSGLPKFRQGTYTGVRRTHSEILKFNEYLTVSNLEVFVPVLPPATTSYPSGGEDETKQLTHVWQEWFDRICANPLLIRDGEFVYFVESDFGYVVINQNRKSLVASGLLRKTLKQLAVPYDPYQELAEFRPVIKAAYLTSQKLHKTMEKNAKSERQLATYYSELATKLKGLSHFETLHPGMKNMWEKMGRAIQVQSDSTLIQLINDLGLLGDGLKQLAADFYEIKEALTNRHLIMREFVQAQAQTKSKHLLATKIKNKAYLDPIKVDEALRALELASKCEESLSMQIKRISGEMMFEKKEATAFVEKKFQHMLKHYLLGRVEQHRVLLRHFENIRLDVRIIDLNGGLSRLNRDNLTQMKHNLTQLQSAGGDNWSLRTFRSLADQEAARETKSVEVETVDAKKAASLLGVATF